MYWRVTHAPLSPIVVAGLSLMFLMAALIGVGALIHAFRDTEADTSRRVLNILYGGFFAVLAGAFWFRVYQNFRRQTKPTKHKP